MSTPQAMSRSPTNVTAGRRIRAEHWRDAAQQGLIAGLSAAGQPAVWDTVPGFSCTIGESTLKYRGWGLGYEHSRLVDHHNGFTVYYDRAAISSASSRSMRTTTTGLPTGLSGRTRQ